MFKNLKNKFFANNTGEGVEEETNVVVGAPYPQEYIEAVTALLVLLQKYILSTQIDEVSLVEFSQGIYGLRINEVEYELDTIASLIELALVNRFDCGISTEIRQIKERGVISRSMKIIYPYVDNPKNERPRNEVVMFQSTNYINRFENIIQMAQDMFAFEMKLKGGV